MRPAAPKTDPLTIIRRLSGSCVDPERGIVAPPVAGFASYSEHAAVRLPERDEPAT